MTRQNNREARYDKKGLPRLSKRDQERVRTYALGLCRSYWHDEGHASHSTCYSCGAQWMRGSMIRDYHRLLANRAKEAKAWARENGWTPPAKAAS